MTKVADLCNTLFIPDRVALTRYAKVTSTLKMAVELYKLKRLGEKTVHRRLRHLPPVPSLKTSKDSLKRCSSVIRLEEELKLL